VTEGIRRDGDDTQRRRLARILRDPVDYFADARRDAHEHARRFLAAQLEARAAQQH
jgi:hypothetical protein